MKTKLTLTIEPALIKSAKELAQSRSTSLSKLIEDLIKEVLEEKKKKSVNISKKYRGILKDTKFAKMSYDELRKEYYEGKHLKK